MMPVQDQLFDDANHECIQKPTIKASILATDIFFQTMFLIGFIGVQWHTLLRYSQLKTVFCKRF